MSKTERANVPPIGAEEYILICKKVANKLRDVPGIEKDATAQAFIATTDIVYSKLHKLTPEEFDTAVGVKETLPSTDDVPSAGEAADIRA